MVRSRCGSTDAWRCRSALYTQIRCMIIQKAREDAWSQKEKSLTVYDFGGPVGKGLCCVVTLWSIASSSSLMYSPWVGTLSRQGHSRFLGCPSEMLNSTGWQKMETTLPILNIRHPYFGTKACKTLPPSAVSTAQLWLQQSVRLWFWQRVSTNFAVGIWRWRKAEGWW